MTKINFWDHVRIYWLLNHFYCILASLSPLFATAKMCLITFFWKFMSLSITHGIFFSSKYSLTQRLTDINKMQHKGSPDSAVLESLYIVRFFKEIHHLKWYFPRKICLSMCLFNPITKKSRNQKMLLNKAVRWCFKGGKNAFRFTLMFSSHLGTSYSSNLVRFSTGAITDCPKIHTIWGLPISNKNETLVPARKKKVMAWIKGERNVLQINMFLCIYIWNFFTLYDTKCE